MICIFNPEHDLCLANGDRHYVPPSSAVAFAAAACGLMRYIYPTATCCPTAEAGEAYLRGGDEMLVPWGWNMTLKYSLLKQGIPERLMPSDDTMTCRRELQHRTTLLSLQPDSCAVTTEAEVEAFLSRHPEGVLKAPWSGSGRGLRWVSHRLTDHDKAWFDKVVREQRCAIAEPRWKVKHDFALEYRVDDSGLIFVGYSLFESANGVYRGNLLLPDEEICRLVGHTPAEREMLEEWLLDVIVPHYRGPLGVDYICDADGSIHISELNLRHTMGLVAHEYMRWCPSTQGTLFTPQKKEDYNALLYP